MKPSAQHFPDGTPFPQWFTEIPSVSLSQLGQVYNVREYGILPDGRIQTNNFQRLIDCIHEKGGGVMLVPAGVYLTGALYLKPKVHLWIERGGMLMGSDNPADYPLCETRIEGETCLYFPALINAVGLKHLVIGGEGTIDGNGLRSWQAFWKRREWNPGCTNKDEQRARLLYFESCSDVLVTGLNLQNAQFWTNHLYQCDHVRYMGCSIFSPASPVKAPSTDAIDIDACTDVHVLRCRMEVNDDAIALKGGKGPWADTTPGNGGNERILIEDCDYGFCHGCLTCGSESIHNKNILVRNITVSCGYNLLWLKMRPDTPQHYEYITVENIRGQVENGINVSPWTQFFDLKGRTDMPVSQADHVTLRNIALKCNTCFNIVPQEDQYRLDHFTFDHMTIKTQDPGLNPALLPESVIQDVSIEVVEEEENHVDLFS